MARSDQYRTMSLHYKGLFLFSKTCIVGKEIKFPHQSVQESLTENCRCVSSLEYKKTSYQTGDLVIIRSVCQDKLMIGEVKGFIVYEDLTVKVIVQISVATRNKFRYFLYIKSSLFRTQGMEEGLGRS